MPKRTARHSTETVGPATADKFLFDGDAMLSRKTGWSTWSEYFDHRDASAPMPDDFMGDRPLNVPFTKKNLFGDKR